MTDKVRMVCASCGSTDVGRDGPCEWDVDQQQWVLIGEYDGNWCNECGGEDCVEEQPIDEESEDE